MALNNDTDAAFDGDDDNGSDEACPDCGAHFGEDHSLDCAYDDDDDIEDDEDEDVEDFA